MPLQNRVAPWGEFIATSARGSLMGNRGILHDKAGTLGAARWKHATWIACRLAFRSRHRDPMPPGRYTALFFLDEATALAAGHRPCGECRRADLAAFRAALGGTDAPLRDLDRHLHAERVDRRTRLIRPHAADIAGLPDGTIFLTPDGPTHAALVDGDAIHPWTMEGYLPPLPRPASGTVDVLTPPTIRRALAGGYRAAWLGG
jgi:hypothetical protein